MKSHQYHLVDYSSWPFMASFGATNFVMCMVLFMQHAQNSGFLFFFALIMLLVCMFGWWRDVISEGSYLGDHTEVVQVGMKLGFMLFMLSELMVFFGLFWGFGHYSLSASMELGGVWPPVNIVPLSAYGVPFFNTLMLLWSGFALTCAHISISLSYKEETLSFLGLTILLGFFFICLQIYEYITAPFNITDSVFGSMFFGLTGLHGMHVMVGVIFLAVCYFSMAMGQVNSKQHLGFDFAVWYWHFVDVIWIFVFFYVYIWGGWLAI